MGLTYSFVKVDVGLTSTTPRMIDVGLINPHHHFSIDVGLKEIYSPTNTMCRVPVARVTINMHTALGEYRQEKRVGKGERE